MTETPREDEEIDKKGRAAFDEATDRIATIWTTEIFDILKERNPDLLDQMTRLEGEIDSLIVIPVKPKALNKQLKDALAKYEQVANDCVQYAARHK